jgi:CDP-glycerol glycerophosphotransferase
MGDDKKALVSIIVPIYNTEQYLRDSLDCLCNQTLEDIEIICINDASTDNCPEILNEYALKDSRITILENETSMGPSICRNMGLDIASGEYITFYDSDDRIDLDAYEKLYEFSKRYNHDVTVFNAIRINDRDRQSPSILHSVSITGETFTETSILEHEELVYDTTSWNKFIKADFFNAHNFRFAEGRVYQDILFSMQLFCSSDCVGICPNVNYYWRIRGKNSKSITQTVFNTKNLHDRIFIITETIKVIKSDEKYHQLLHPLYVKLIEIDVLQFINELDRCDEEFKEIMFGKVRDFVKTLPEDVFDTVEEIGMIKYDLFLNNCADSLKAIVGKERQDKVTIRKSKAEKRKIEKANRKLEKKNQRLENANQRLKNKNDKLKTKNANLKDKNQVLNTDLEYLKTTSGWIKYKVKKIT